MYLYLTQTIAKQVHPKPNPSPVVLQNTRDMGF